MRKLKANFTHKHRFKNKENNSKINLEFNLGNQDWLNVKNSIKLIDFVGK